MHELDEQLRELIPRLRRFAVSLTRNASSADDLVQSTLERAIISWADKRVEGDLRAWLFSILYRQFLDAHRRTRRYARMLEFFTGRDDAQPSVERTVIAQSTLQAFDQLNTEQRALHARSTTPRASRSIWTLSHWLGSGKRVMLQRMPNWAALTRPTLP
uniref:RNA polymerase sigma factor n=1 Tax=Pseudomonas simiae TaxID=321846 RepID=UPI0020963123